MNGGPRRGVTRGYVGGLIAAALVVAAALIIASWGLLGLALDRDPVATPDVRLAVAPGALGLVLALLAWMLWRQAIALLRGTRTPAWGGVIIVAGGAYLVWCAVGTVAGMELHDTWLSPFSALLVAICAIVALMFWAVLARRLYTDHEVPKWPWEQDTEDR